MLSALSGGDKLSDAADTAAAPEDLIDSVEYLREAVRVSEKLIAELQLSIVSFEKKSFAVIAAAVAIAGFLMTEQWCGGVTDTLRIIGIVCAVAAVFIAGFVISATDIGIAGAYPEEVTAYWYDLDKKDKTGSEKEQYLYLMLLKKYQAGAKTSEREFTRKEAKFTIASYLLLISFIALLLWAAAAAVIA